MGIDRKQPFIKSIDNLLPIFNKFVLTSCISFLLLKLEETCFADTTCLTGVFLEKLFKIFA